MQASIMPGGRRSTLAVFSCSCSAVRLAVLLSMRAFRSATLSRYSASFVACAATSVSQQCPHQDGGQDVSFGHCRRMAQLQQS